MSQILGIYGKEFEIYSLRLFSPSGNCRISTSVRKGDQKKEELLFPLLWQVANHWISGKGTSYTEETVGVKVLRWEGVSKLEEGQEDQSGWGNPPRYELWGGGKWDQREKKGQVTQTSEAHEMNSGFNAEKGGSHENALSRGMMLSKFTLWWDHSGFEITAIRGTCENQEISKET